MMLNNSLYRYKTYSIRIVLFVSILCSNVSTAFAQNKVTLKYSFTHHLENDIMEKLPTFVDTLSDDSKLLNGIVNQLKNCGYAASSIDSLKTSQDTLELYVYLGNRLQLTHIVQDSISGEWLEIERNTLPFCHWNRRYSQEEELLALLADNGYPRAKLLRTRTHMEGDTTYILWRLYRGPSIEYGNIITLDTSVVHRSFLMKYLNIRTGETFESSNVQKIYESLNQLKFIQINSPPKITLSQARADIELDISSKPVSNFDFILGVLPSVKNSERQFNITGKLQALFVNKLKRGEEFAIQFNQLRPETQRFNAHASYPYIFGTSLAVFSSFELYKNKSTTLDINTNVGLKYLRIEDITANFYSSFTSSRLLEVDTISIRTKKELPNSLDISTKNLGASIQFDFLNTSINPTKGWFANVNVSLGSRNILPNSTITNIQLEDVDFSAAYDSISSTSILLMTSLNIRKIFYISDRVNIQFQNETKFKYSPKNIFQNEYFRIGGNSSIRGFDEEILLGQIYSYLTVEGHYILAEASYFSIFSDYGWIKNKYLTKDWNRVLTFGVGLVMRTSSGIFKIAIAMGSQSDIPFDYRNTKTHFGYLSMF